jgi:hypothetical protein
VLPVCEVVVQEIRAAHLARVRGQGDALDGHRLLLREKIAAGLDILDRRPEVSQEAWELARVVLAISDRTRDACREAIAASAREANLSRARGEGQRAVIVEQARANAEAVTHRVCRSILRSLEGGEWRAHAEVRRSLASDARGYFAPAVERLVVAGQVEVEEISGGVRYRRVEER